MNAPLIGFAVLLALAAAAPAAAQPAARPAPAALQAAQREAMTKLAFMDGVWRGEAWNISPSGEKHTLTQTERVGTFLDGTVRVIEGRGYSTDGSVAFNALGIVSYSPDRKAYGMRSYAMGFAGDFALTPTGSGFIWEIQAGPMTMKYTATFKDGVWHEVGHRIMQGGEPAQFFEMTLRRIGDSDWPAAGAIPPVD